MVNTSTNYPPIRRKIYIYPPGKFHLSANEERSGTTTPVISLSTVSPRFEGWPECFDNPRDLLVRPARNKQTLAPISSNHSSPPNSRPSNRSSTDKLIRENDDRWITK